MKNMINPSIRNIATKLYIKLYSGNSDTVAMHTRSFRMGVVTGLLLIAGLLPMIAAAQTPDTAPAFAARRDDSHPGIHPAHDDSHPKFSASHRRQRHSHLHPDQYERPVPRPDLQRRPPPSNPHRHAEHLRRG